ncbi:MAG TPA: flagellar biosynthesis protein FlhF [Tissierellia bacterium]|nr:flagellar biosynthesis protein FlhF [Tissierellia bacterium]
MMIKKYIGSTTHEAIEKMKRELGMDAVILNTRTVKQKGMFGIFKKPLVEITAAYEMDNKSSNRRSDMEDIKKISSELADLKGMVEKISYNIHQKEEKIDPNLKEYWIKLVENGVQDTVATSIFSKLSQQVDLSIKDSISIRNIVKRVLVEYIGESDPLKVKDGGQKIVFFVGPTGVGKTTTLAKIAAQMVLRKEYDIGLITSDTYRIAAVEQLRIYSEILNIPLEVIYNEEDMYKALVHLKEKDLIFVDTTGKNHKEVDKEDELFKMINSIKNKEIYLVLSSTTDFVTLKSILNRYSFIDNYKIIFTKIDEAERLGNILNIKYLTNKPISYVTTGQNVPDDIKIMNSDEIVGSLLGEI